MDEPSINEVIRDDRPDKQTPSRPFDHASHEELTLSAYLRREPLACSATRTIGGRWIFADIAFKPSALHFRPCFLAGPLQAPDRKHTFAILDKVFKNVPPGRERLCSEIVPVRMEQIKRDIHRRRGDDIGVRPHEEVKPRHQPFIEHTDLSVKDQVDARQRGDSLRERREACCMVEPASAHELDVGATLVRDHAPAVHLLLVDSAGAIEGLDKGRMEEMYLEGKAGRHHFYYPMPCDAAAPPCGRVG